MRTVTTSMTKLTPTTTSANTVTMPTPGLLVSWNKRWPWACPNRRFKPPSAKRLQRPRGVEGWPLVANDNQKSLGIGLDLCYTMGFARLRV